VNPIQMKTPAARLETKEYAQLRTRVMRRDGWRCQSCGSIENLEVHHKDYRSQSGADVEDNLITVCSACHRSIHASRFDVKGWG
jgi:5-methylcytosine-specific restriction endonuclease McrA